MSHLNWWMPVKWLFLWNLTTKQVFPGLPNQTGARLKAVDAGVE